MWHSKCQVKAFYWNRITVLVLYEFKVFTVHLQTVVLVKFLTRSEPRYLTCYLVRHWPLPVVMEPGMTQSDARCHSFSCLIFYLIHQPGIELDLSINVRLHFVMPTSGLHYEWHLLFGPNSSVTPKSLHCSNFKPGTQRCNFSNSCYTV